MGTVLSRLWAHRPRGRLKILLAAVRLMSPLRRTIIILLVTRWIMVRLRATNRQSRFPLVRRLPSRCSIRLRISILRVDMVLLYMTMLGLRVTVCVTVTCRCRLLESLPGQWFTMEVGTLITLSSLPIWPVCYPELLTPRTCSGLLTEWKTEHTGLSELQGPRNIGRMRWWKLSRLPVPNAEALWFLQNIPLEAGPRRRRITPVMADPLELDLFMTVRAALCPMEKDMLLMVPNTLPPWGSPNLPAKRLMATTRLSPLSASLLVTRRLSRVLVPLLCLPVETTCREVSDGVVVMSCPAHGRRGRRSILRDGLDLMIRFPHTMITRRVCLVVRFRLRATNSMVAFNELASTRRRLRTCPRMAMLRVEAGLLVTSRLGW